MSVVKSAKSLIKNVSQVIHSTAQEESKELAKKSGAFSRPGAQKIDLESYMKMEILHCGNTLSDLCEHFFGAGSVRPSDSALSQAKHKASLYIAQSVFDKTNALYPMKRTYKSEFCTVLE